MSTSQETAQVISRLLIIFALCSVAACARRSKPINSLPPPVVVEELAEGTEDYCWQEPLVKDEKNGPGVDEQGHWYHAPHIAVREVKMGQWKPCSESSR